MSLHLKPGQLTLADLRQAYLAPVRLSLDPSADAPVAASVACVENIIAEGRTAYGINTGFGLLASTRISPADLEKLQRSIVLSHAAGVGEALDDAMVRLVMLLKVNSLARGFSGIRRKVIDALIALINAEVYPHIPLKGSVGASGDLAPLAHMSLVLIGESRARHRGEWLPAAEALAVAGLEPLTLAAKEGLALLNGTQVSTAYALRGLFEAEDLFAAATVCGGLSVEAMLGSRAPFDARIHAARGQRGQIDVAAAYRDLLTASSEVARSHEKCDKVQDPYSLRCQPQVMGACLTQMRQAAEVLEIEANAVSDNPLVFAAEGDVISGGNFHAEPVAMAADNLALALAEIGSLSERRISLMMDMHMSQLPPFLVANGGVNSGFMIAQVTAAALASDNKALAHPASVDSLPTSANQEDHVSMAPNAGKRLWAMAENVRGILAVEWLGACQGLDFREGLKSSPKLEQARRLLRDKVPYYQEDRFFAPDIEAASQLLASAGPAVAEPLIPAPGRSAGALQQEQQQESRGMTHDTGLRRGLNARHIRFMALGSAIGTGLFYGSASAIQMAGPAVLLAYLVAGAAVYMVMRALGEMAVHEPVSGSFGHYASSYLGPLAGFVTGWTYAFEMIIVCLADVTAFGIYMGFWFPDVPRWIWVLSIVLFIGGLNLCHVKVFGELEFWLSLVKVGAIVAMILAGLGIMFFGFSLDGAVTSATGVHNLWQHGGFLPNGWAGLVASLSVVVFAFGGIEIIGITAGEAQDPQRVIPRAINAVPLRILLFYVLTLFVLMAIFPWQQIGSNGSPFVQIFDGLGIESAAAILNVVVITAAISAINSDIFGAGRMLYGMARQGQAPVGFSRVSRHGVPWMTVLLMAVALLLGVALNYLIPQSVFLLIASIATFATVWVWLMILLAQVGMRRRMGPRQVAALKFPVPLWPFAPAAAIVFMLFIFVVLGYFPDTRPALWVGAIWIAVLVIAYRRWVRPKGDAAHGVLQAQGGL